VSVTRSTKRFLVRVDEKLCIKCGVCPTSCSKQALEVVRGRAKLVDDACCEGDGACIDACLQGALSLQLREAVAFDEVSVERRRLKRDRLRALGADG
jgi:MinD superfamily P-loop ATPase